MTWGTLNVSASTSWAGGMGGTPTLNVPVDVNGPDLGAAFWIARGLGGPDIPSLSDCYARCKEMLASGGGSAGSGISLMMDDAWAWAGGGSVVVGLGAAIFGTGAVATGGVIMIGVGAVALAVWYFGDEAFERVSNPLDDALRHRDTDTDDLSGVGSGIGAFLACIGACEQGFQPIRPGPGRPAPISPDQGPGPAV